MPVIVGDGTYNTHADHTREQRRGGTMTVDEYINAHEGRSRELLMQMRSILRQAAPQATERISYGMPTLYLHGNLVHFAAQKAHLGFYPSPSGITAFPEELLPYKTSKGAVQFPYDQPLPVQTIERIVRFRVEENLRKADKV
jgi:uncharacterized protein YdhG (YjbR/CyaY superfamily)